MSCMHWNQVLCDFTFQVIFAGHVQGAAGPGGRAPSSLLGAEACTPHSPPGPKSQASGPSQC